MKQSKAGSYNLKDEEPHPLHRKLMAWILVQSSYHPTTHDLDLVDWCLPFTSSEWKIDYLEYQVDSSCQPTMIDIRLQTCFYITGVDHEEL